MIELTTASKPAGMSHMTPEVYKQWYPYIMKKACLFATMAKYANNHLGDKEDFASEVYIQLHKQLSYCNMDKVVDKSKFSYFIYVKQAVLKTVHVFRKNEIKSISIHDKNVQEPSYNDHIDDDAVHSVTTIDFYKKLTPRQTTIIKMRQNGKTISSIAKHMNLSYGSIHRDIYFAKSIFEEMFSIKAHKFNKHAE